MDRNEILNKIRKELFYGSSEYTKNQPDLFIPHKFKMLAPSQANDFLNSIKESIIEDEVLIYIHLPFCFSECLFCNSFPHKADKKIQQKYLENLLKEIEFFSHSGVFDGKKVKSIYFGGGTPTSFSNNDLKRIIDKIITRLDLSKNCNITSEAHPVTLADEKRIEGLAEMGINRISIGCQTFDPEILKYCNRRNTEEQIRKIVEKVQASGLAINIDMMVGLPGQTVEKLQKDLQILETIKPDAVECLRHEIVNPLVVALYRERPELVVDSDVLFELVLIAQEWMDGNGYEQNGRFSNAKQWEYRYHWLNEMPLLAFGSRARSYTNTFCYDKHEELATYSLLINKGVAPVGRFIHLTKREQMYRTLFLSLQLKSGLQISQFRARYSENPLDLFGPIFTRLAECGCLVQDDESVKLTKYGAYFVEDICDFIIDKALEEESGDLVRVPNSEGSTSARLVYVN